MTRKRRLLAVAALAAAGLGAAVVRGGGRRTETAGYELRPAAPPASAAAVTLSVVVPNGAPRARLAAIRDELRRRYASAKLLRLGFYDDAAAAERPQGPDTPAPGNAWWRHYLAQYNLNRNTHYEWFGRLYADHAEPWE